MTDVSVYVDGQNLAALGFVGDLRWSHQRPGGCWDASWSMLGLSRSAASQVLRKGAEVRIFVGTWPIWTGVLDELGDSMTSFSAQGYYRRAEKHLAGSSNIDTAIAAAVTNGIGWDYTPGDAPAAVPTDQVEYLSQMIDTAATAAGERWGIDAHRRFFCDVDATEPTLLVTPGTPIMGSAEEGQVTRITGEYFSALAGTPPVPSTPLTVSAVSADETPANFAAVFVDLKPRGVLTTPEAQSIIDGMLAKADARTVFNEPITVGRHQLLTTGGVPADPALVRDGLVVRVYGVVNPDGSPVAGGSVDLVIGKTEYAAGSSQITLSPINKAPRNLSEILAVTPLEQAVA